MPETGAQSGVRSLLARFEGNNQNITTTSPPSRGRSPVPSDTPGSGRPLSKVRASFVAVDRAAQSSPVPGLRKESGRSDSPAIGSEDADAPLRSPVSPPPSNGLDVQTPADDTATRTHQVDAEQKEATEGNHVPKDDDTSESPATKESKPEPNRLAPAAPVEKPQRQSSAAKTVTKQPSNARLAQNKAAAATSSKPPSTRAKSPAPRTASSTKPAGERAVKPARQSTTTTTRIASNEPARNLTQKPSRTTLNPASKTTTRTSRDNAKSTPSPTAQNSKPARLPLSTTAPSLTSAAKTGTTRSGAGTGNNLNRKPSSLKNTTNGSQRATTPTSSSIRKETSRASLPSQSSNERPGSRVSNTSTKPVDEGFLARMMRPTASSASKAHEKVEAKSPPRSSSRPRAPAQKKATPMTGNRAAHAKKEKDASEKTQTETPQSESREPEPKELKDVQSVPSAKEAVLPPADSLKKPEEAAVKAAEKATEEPIKSAAPEKPEEPAVETAEKAPVQSVESPAEPAVEAVEDASVDKPVESVESTAEQAEEAAEPAGEAGEMAPVEPSAESAEPTIQDSGNVSTEDPALTATVPRESSAAPQAEPEPVQQPESATGESPNALLSAPEEQIPTISEPPPTEPAQPSADNLDNPASIDPKESIIRDQSGGSSVETSFVDTVENVATPDPTPDTPDVASKQESEQLATTATTTPATAN